MSDQKNQAIIELSDIVLFIARHVKKIALITSASVILTISYLLFFSEPIYLSYSKIISSNNANADMGGVSGLASQFGINFPSQNIGQDWIHADVIKSRSLAKRVLLRKFDTKKYGDKKSLLEILIIKLGFSNLDDKENLFLSTEEFVNNLVNVNEDQKSGIFTLSVYSFDPKLAHDINEAIIEELESQREEHNEKAASKTRKFIEERIIETKKELEVAEEQLKDFRARNRRIENSPLLLLEQERLSREAIVLTGVFTTLKQQLETTKIEEVKDSDYILVIDEPFVPLNPFKPQKFKIVSLGLIFGILLSFIVALTYDYIEFSFKKNKKGKEIMNIMKDNIFSLFRLRS